MFARIVAVLLLLTVIAPISFAQVLFAQTDHPGIKTEKPAEGRFVELEDGRFMVPFSMKIPGTEVEFEMVPIAGGKFTMGSPESEEDRSDAEGPQVEIVVDPFWMGKHEVTWAEYKVFMRLDTIFKKFNSDGIRQVTEETKIDAITAPSGLYEPSFTYDAGDGPNQPAATMSQFAAKQYTKWLSQTSGQFFRLPSEGEWEYACRAGTNTAYYFGDDPDLLEEHAWFDDNADYERQDVGQLEPNPWGLYDMYGNVAEWVLDEYNEDGFGRFSKLEDDEDKSTPVTAWPTDLHQRALKGGSFEMMAEDCRSASRLGSEEYWRIDDPNTPRSPWWYTTEPATGIGFRIICPLHVPKTRKAKEKFWEADHISIVKEVKSRTSIGKGSIGIADPTLPEVINNGKKK